MTMPSQSCEKPCLLEQDEAHRPGRLRYILGPIGILAALIVLITSARVSGFEAEPSLHSEGTISDEMARLTLARVLSYRAHTLGEARREYERILSEHPDHLDAGMELADVLNRLREPDAAQMQLERLLAAHPNHSGVLQRLAELEASRGHASASRSHFEKAIALEPQNDGLKLAYARAMFLWGDFYRIERIYQALLQKDPEDVPLRLNLAEVLVSSQRYEEAEGIYERLRLEGLDPGRYGLEMARLHERKKDVAKALGAIDRVLSMPSRPSSWDPPKKTLSEAAESEHRWSASALALKADLLARIGRIEEAEACIAALMGNPSTELTAWTTSAKLYHKLALSGKAPWKKAREAAARAMQLAALQHPDLASLFKAEEGSILGQLPRELIPIRYADPGQRVFDADFLEHLLNEPQPDPLDLCAWAERYTEDGRPDMAWRIYARAVEIDPACFPARLGLAETLAFDHRYTESLEILESLCKEEPDHGKLWITYARVLSWDKQYERAIDAYDRIHDVNPTDPTPIRESARVAVWAKRMGEAMNRYRSLMAPAADELLRQALLEQPAASSHGLCETLFGACHPERHSNGYAAYEAFVERMDREPELSADETLQRIRMALLPRYRIQKGADLEGTAKLLAWDKHFLAAREAYAQLLAFDPGNAEALFDDAQVKCALGLCDEEARPYEALLQMDPTHVQAARGLDRNEIRARLRIGIDGRSWTEKGRGDLSDITVRHFRWLSEMPLRQGRYAISAGVDSWYEHPAFDDRSADALGYTLQSYGVLLPSLFGNIRWTRKVYQEADLGASDLFDISLHWKIWDWLRADLGYERTDEIANTFALLQQSQADRWKIGIQSWITRRLDAALKAEFIDYSDNNTGKLLSGSVGYAFMDHPRIFKVTWTETWRDTDNDNRYLYAAERLIDIVHPYWTPRSLTESTITLEWNHDLAQDLFCGAPENVYDVRLSFGTDTEDNATIRIEADWKVEIADRWLLLLRGLIHESRQWDADGIWTEIRYRF